MDLFGSLHLDKVTGIILEGIEKLYDEYYGDKRDVAYGRCLRVKTEKGDFNIIMVGENLEIEKQGARSGTELEKQEKAEKVESAYREGMVTKKEMENYKGVFCK